MKKNFVLMWALLITALCQAQGRKADSLQSVYKNLSLPDTARLNALNDLAWSLSNNKPDTCILLARELLNLAERMHQARFAAKALNMIGVSYARKGNYPKALEYNLEALKIRESIGDKIGVGYSFNNIGNLYDLESDLTNGLVYHLKALAIFEETGEKKRLGSAYNNTGIVYYKRNANAKALDYFFKAVQAFAAMGDKFGLSDVYNNIANVYGKQRDYLHALDYYEKALDMNRQAGDSHGMGLSCMNLGNMYFGQGKYPLAIAYADSSLTLAKQVRDRDNERVAYGILSESYAAQGKFKEAYLNLGKFKELTDTLYNQQNSRQMGDLRTRFEVEKREAELTAKASAEKAIALQERKAQQLIIYAVCTLFVLVLVFALVLYHRFRISQQQKQIIEKQKELVEHNQNEIISSITYAKRLQQAILPPALEIKKYLPEGFLIYKPKDIVAGDFYWMEQADGHLFVAVADCTGHGVPGALVSIVCSNSLNRAIKEFGLRETGLILDKTRELVLETFSKSNSEVMDGMDISLLSINTLNQKITWSGANSPLWYIVDGPQGKALVEIKADKQPIGKMDNPFPFTCHAIPPGKHSFYLFTDGYADQFGGPRSKKFKRTALQDLFLQNAGKPMVDQKAALEKAFDEWKGNLAQIDDFCILGFQVDIQG